MVLYRTVKGFIQPQLLRLYANIEKDVLLLDKRALFALSVIVSALMFVLIAFNIMTTENVVTQEHSVTKQTEHIENISDKAMVLDGWVCV